MNFLTALKLDPANKAVHKQLQLMKSKNLIYADWPTIDRMINDSLKWNNLINSTGETETHKKMDEVKAGIKKVKIETQDVEMKESNGTQVKNGKQTLPAQIEMKPFSLPKQNPNTLFQFICMWNEIKCPQQRVDYLKLVGSELLLRLLAKGVEPDLFTDLVTCLNEWQNAEFALQTLQGLTKVARFDTLTLFMNEKEKAGK